MASKLEELLQKKKRAKAPDVVLRKAEKHDVATLAQWMQEDDYFFLLSVQRQPTLKDTKDRLLEQIGLNSLLFPTRQTLLAETPLGVPLGFITLARIDWRSRTCALEAYFDQKYRDTPYPIAAGVKVFAYVFQELNMQKVYSFVQAFNEKSISLHNKYGAKPEAVLKDYIFKDGKYHDMYIFATYRDTTHYKDLPKGILEETYATFTKDLDDTRAVTRLLIGLKYLPEKFAAGKLRPSDQELQDALKRYQTEHSLEPTGKLSSPVLFSMIDEIYPVLREHYHKS